MSERRWTYRQVFEQERLIVSVTTALAEARESAGLLRKDMAERMAVDPASVTRLLAGHRNVTLRTLSLAALALGKRVEFRLVPLPPEPPHA